MKPGSKEEFQFAPTARGEVLTAISDGVVGMLKEYYGRGPTSAKTYVQDDLVVCMMREGFTRVEQTLIDEGRHEEVLAQRAAFQDVMRPRYTALVEGVTGREVIAFMSGNHHDPKLIYEMFLLDGAADA